MSGPVSVSEDGGSIQQNISWQPPLSGEVMMYLIRYGMGVSNMENATSIITPNISILLTLSVPDGPQDMVVYNIWVAVVMKSEEQGSFTQLSIQYTSKLCKHYVDHTVYNIHIHLALHTALFCP